MKHQVVLGLAIAAIVLSLVMSNKEKFENIDYYGGDHVQKNQTISTEDSSYAQRTNSMPPPPIVSPPLTGQPTPFQVNQWNAYV
jgi:hypothetical protein